MELKGYTLTVVTDTNHTVVAHLPSSTEPLGAVEAMMDLWDAIKGPGKNLLGIILRHDGIQVDCIVAD